MAPAVEGVEQAHGLFLVFRGERFYDGADQHLQKPASYGIDHDRSGQADERIRCQLGQYGKTDQSCGGSPMGDEHGSPVSDPVDETGGEEIDQQLDQKIGSDQRSDSSK